MSAFAATSSCKEPVPIVVENCLRIRPIVNIVGRERRIEEEWPGNRSGSSISKEFRKVRALTNSFRMVIPILFQVGK